eukprot:TRINITY_DN62084_c0_g1_i1.p1 TRINITY_DN62084_c0_g1~~TRINITY_DN62084_c0_g1_i1.p1  ORF type:complete len:150 (-),score=17.00 TRINITY_DN62084_c0_g1_i1:242-691(-)
MRVAGRSFLKFSPSLRVSKTAAPRGAHSRGFLDVVEQARPFVVEVSVAELPNVLVADSSAQVVDVREDSEWAAGHLKGAIHLGRGVLERDIEAKFPDRGTRLLFYCGGGYRSVLAAKSANEMGYSNVASVAGGWRAMLNASMDIEKPAV